MATLTNKGRRAYGLPTRHGTDGARFVSRVLEASASVEVPAWYAAELRAEPGLAALVERGELVLQEHAAPPPASPAPAEAPAPAPAPPPPAPARADAPPPRRRSKTT